MIGSSSGPTKAHCFQATIPTRLNTPVTASDMGAQFLTANSAAKRSTSIGSVRILPEYSEKPVLKLNLDDIEEFFIPEFQHRLSMYRSKKSLLETIVEEPVNLRILQN
ncbi:hypothetical protein Fot_11424 [Forsythia ovata]|uniref:Uncharacterized protein n=1 Tax=Forsythia ovata TaxID=205694 RepID=A0ABD1WJN1_9LAMI